MGWAPDWSARGSRGPVSVSAGPLGSVWWGVMIVVFGVGLRSLIE
jgi:hypothetical protein